MYCEASHFFPPHFLPLYLALHTTLLPLCTTPQWTHHPTFKSTFEPHCLQGIRRYSRHPTCALILNYLFNLALIIFYCLHINPLVVSQDVAIIIKNYAIVLHSITSPPKMCDSEHTFFYPSPFSLYAIYLFKFYTLFNHIINKGSNWSC